MKDDKFDRLMEKYVSSTKRGADVDLQKLREKSQEEIKSKRIMPKYAWVACAVILVITISLSVALPILLNKEEGPQSFYCDSSQIQDIEVNDIAEFKDKYNFDCLIPSIAYLDSILQVMNYKENDTNIGIFIDLAVFDEYFDSVTINVIKKPYALIEFKHYDNFTDKVIWRETMVRYLISDYDNDGYYSYQMTFTIGEYNYFIYFDNYNTMKVSEILDLIY